MINSTDLVFVQPIHNFCSSNRLLLKYKICCMWNYCPNVSTTPNTAMGCRQCLPLSVVQLKGKHCQKSIAVMELQIRLGIKKVSPSVFTFIGPNDPLDSGKIRVPWLEPQPLLSCMIKVKVQLISRFLTKETFPTFTATNKRSPLVACSLKNSD